MRSIIRGASVAGRSIRNTRSMGTVRNVLGTQGLPRIAQRTPIRMISNTGFTGIRGYATRSRPEVLSRVIDVVKSFDKASATSEIKDTTLFHKDLGLDSLDTVELLVAIEEEFDLEIPDKVADELRSVGETVDFILKQ